MKQSNLFAWLLLISLSLIWGSSFILIKKGLVALTAQEVGSLRIVSAFLFLVPFSLVRLRRVPKEKYLSLLLAGLLGSLVPSFLFANAQTHLDSAITGVLNTLVPIFTILIAFLFFKQRQSKKVFLGITIGFLGSMILITSGNGASFGSVNAYALLVVLATVCYAANLNLIKAKLDDLDPLTVTSISLLAVGPFATIYLFGFTSFWNKVAATEGSGLSILYICVLGVFGTAIALIIFNRILQITDALFASSVTYLIPIIAVIWGLADGESIYPIQYMGMAAVGLGVYIANSNRLIYKKKGNK